MQPFRDFSSSGEVFFFNAITPSRYPGFARLPTPETESARCQRLSPSLSLCSVSGMKSAIGCVTSHAALCAFDETDQFLHVRRISHSFLISASACEVLSLTAGANDTLASAPAIVC